MRLPTLLTVDCMRARLTAFAAPLGVALCAWLLVLSAARAEPGAPIEPREAREWLMRIHNAASQRNFQGTFVVGSMEGLSSARISHFLKGADQFEWIEPLDGQLRHVLRHNAEVHTVWPASHLTVVEQRDVIHSFPSLLLGGIDRISDFYDVRLQRVERVAGHEANVLLLTPRDAYRHGYRLWADERSGLLLRADLLNERGEMLERVAFSDVLIGVRPQPEVVLQSMRTPPGHRVVRPRLEPTQLQAEGWEMRKSVAGFQALSCLRRPMDNLSSVEPANPSASAIHAVFSDGITYVSLFIEPYSDERPMRSMQGSSGATQTLMSRRGDFRVTFVGDVPAATLQAFNAALERRK